MTESQYDVALSFAGPQRAFVEEVARALRYAGVPAFFDDFEAVDLWGQDLAVHFDDVYRCRARYVVPFVSREYAERAWPQHEFKSALARAVEEREPYILPVRFDDTDLPGLRPTIGYLDGRRLSPAQVAEHILKKLGRSSGPGVEAEPSRVLRVPAVPPVRFNPYAEAERAVKILQAELSRRSNALQERGYAVDARERGGRFMFRVLRSGETVYGLDVWIGGPWGDNTICFAIGTRLSGDPNSTNATGKLEWDRERGLPIIAIFNMGVLREMGREYRLTAEELADEFWEAICQHLESRIR